MSLFSSAILVFLGLLPSFAWLFFYIREDVKHPEPKILIIFSFIVGGLITFAVLPIQLWLNKELPPLGIPIYSLGAFLILGAIEEIFKFLAVYVFIHHRREFDEPLHAMIYMITAALGFAAVENVASVFQVAGGSFLNIAILESITLRFVGATLLHSLSSGLVGYYWGQAFGRGLKAYYLRHKRELLFVGKGLVIASILHAVFNYLIIKTGPSSLAIVFVVFVGFFLLSDFEKFKKADI